MAGCAKEPNGCEERGPWYIDADGDGWGASGLEVDACSPEGAPEAGDCDDADPDVNPGVEEECGNGIDDNCDGLPAPCGFGVEESSGDAGLTVIGSASGGYLGMSSPVVLGIEGSSPDEGLLAFPTRDGDSEELGAKSISFFSGTAMGEHWTAEALARVVPPPGGGYFATSLFWVEPSAAFPGGALLVNDLGYDEDEGVSTARNYLLSGPMSGDRLLTGDEALFNGEAGGRLLSRVISAPTSADHEAAFQKNGRIRVHDLAAVHTAAFDDDARILIDTSISGTVLDAHADLDGDGISEVLTSRAVYSEIGRVQAFDLSIDGYYTYDDALLTIHGVGKSDFFGQDLDASVDLDGDGLPEIAVARRFEGGGSGTDAYIFQGGEVGTLGVSDAICIIGDDIREETGESIQLTEDLTGDGVPDLLLGAGGNDGSSAVYLMAGPLSGAVVTSEAVTTFVSEGTHSVVSRGTAIPDRDGDGVPEVAVANPCSVLGNGDCAGAVFLFDSLRW